MMHKHTHRYKEAKKVTLIGAGKNIILGLLKVFGGVWYSSSSLLADGIHSFADLLTDMMVLVASKYGSQEADSSHPYGHQKIETAATTLLAVLLILAGIGIAWDAIYIMISQKIQTPKFYSLIIIIFSIIANEILFLATKKVGHAIKSDLLLANAWHHRSDSAASFVVLIGIIGSLVGYKFFDPIAALFVGAFVIKMGAEYGWESMKQLVDTTVDIEQVKEIENAIQNMDGVRKLHQLRTRMMGQDLFIDVHILVDSYISVSEGHHIAQLVHNKLLKQYPMIKDVVIHVDPEDDEKCAPSLNLPNRKQLYQLIVANWQKKYPEITSWYIHYIDGKIRIDLYLTTNFNQNDSLGRLIYEDIQAVQYITEVNILIMQAVILNKSMG